MKPTRTALLLIGALMAVPAACGSSTETTGSNSTTTNSSGTSGTSDATALVPCTSVAPTDVARIFGGTAAVDATLKPTTTGCTWNVTGSLLGMDGQVAVATLPTMTRAQFELANTTKAEPLDSLGDAAFYSPRTQALTVLEGETVLVVQARFVGANAAEVKSRVTDLTRLLLERL